MINHCPSPNRQETHHEMRIPERDVTYIVLLLSVYLHLPVPLGIAWIITNKMDYTQVNLS